MEKQKREKLEAQGWQVGSVSDFLELTPADLVVIEMKIALSRRLEEWQRQSKTSSIPVVSQADTTQNIQPNTSIEQLIHDMLKAGLSPKEIGQLIASVG